MKKYTVLDEEYNMPIIVTSGRYTFDIEELSIESTITVTDEPQEDFVVDNHGIQRSLHMYLDFISSSYED